MKALLSVQLIENQREIKYKDSIYFNSMDLGTYIKGKNDGDYLLAKIYQKVVRLSAEENTGKKLLPQNDC